MEIYDDTYEKIAYKIQEKEQPIKKVPEKLPENEEDALDMFGDEFDEKVAKSESKNNGRLACSLIDVTSMLILFTEFLVFKCILIPARANENLNIPIVYQYRVYSS